jgi:Fe-S-cluster-containing hydrogenase component 2
VKIGRDESRCTGCKTCQLTCALVHFKENNPKKAAIGIMGRFPAPGTYKISLCTQCEKCISVCPEEAISNQDGVITIDPDKCTYCLACVDECPFGAIFTHREFQVPFICDVCGECVEICPTKALNWKE